MSAIVMRISQVRAYPDSGPCNVVESDELSCMLVSKASSGGEGGAIELAY